MRFAILFVIAFFLITFIIFSCTDKNKKSKPVPETKNDTFTEEPPPAEYFSGFSLELSTIDGESGLADYAKGAEKVIGKVVKQLKGSDGSEYYLFKMDKLLNYTDNKKNLTTSYLIIGGRFKEQPLQRNALNTTINVAIVKDESVITDPLLNFDKMIFVGMGEATAYEK